MSNLPFHSPQFLAEDEAQMFQELITIFSSAAGK